MSEAQRYRGSPYKKYHESLFYEAAVNIDYRNSLLNEIFSSRFQPDRKPSRCKINQLPSVAETELQNQRQRVEVEGYFDIQNLEDARQRVLTSIVRRQGQSEFRQKLLDAYDRKCAITDCDVETAIEAAHIIPYQGATTNYLENGLPLRADVHTLFDLHLISIKPDSYEVIIAPELFGTCYQQLDKKN